LTKILFVPFKKRFLFIHGFIFLFLFVYFYFLVNHVIFLPLKKSLFIFFETERGEREKLSYKT